MKTGSDGRAGGRPAVGLCESVAMAPKRAADVARSRTTHHELRTQVPLRLVLGEVARAVDRHALAVAHAGALVDDLRRDADDARPKSTV